MVARRVRLGDGTDPSRPVHPPVTTTGFSAPFGASELLPEGVNAHPSEDAAGYPAADRPTSSYMQWLLHDPQPPAHVTPRSLRDIPERLPDMVYQSPGPLVTMFDGVNIPPGMVELPCDLAAVRLRSHCPHCVLVLRWGLVGFDGTESAVDGWYCTQSHTVIVRSGTLVLEFHASGSIFASGSLEPAAREARRRAYLWGLVIAWCGVRQGAQFQHTHETFRPVRPPANVDGPIHGPSPCATCEWVCSYDQVDLYVDRTYKTVVRVTGPWPGPGMVAIRARAAAVPPYTALGAELRAAAVGRGDLAVAVDVVLSGNATGHDGYHPPISAPFVATANAISLPRGATSIVVSVDPEPRVSCCLPPEPDRVVQVMDRGRYVDGQAASPRGRLLFTGLLEIAAGRVTFSPTEMQAFELLKVDEQECYIPGSVNLWNVHRNGDICWGNDARIDKHGEMRAAVAHYLASPVNADLTWEALRRYGHRCSPQHECPGARTPRGECNEGGHECPDINARHRHECAHFRAGESVTCRADYLQLAASYDAAKAAEDTASAAPSAPARAHAVHTCRVSARTGNRIGALRCPCCQESCECPAAPGREAVPARRVSRPRPEPCPCCHDSCNCHTECACYDGTCECGTRECPCCNGSCDCTVDARCPHSLSETVRLAHASQVREVLESPNRFKLPVDPYGDASMQFMPGSDKALQVLVIVPGPRSGWLRWTDDQKRLWSLALARVTGEGSGTVTAPQAIAGQVIELPSEYVEECEDDNED